VAGVALLAGLTKFIKQQCNSRSNGDDYTRV